ncbi:hypothetical protein [Streptomyces sp. NPDC051129]|uniref:hypothetical protein n=1 Tax=Streptomyces sp. NPDC051129 TaxID=3154639 RepID=UPI003441F10D
MAGAALTRGGRLAHEAGKANLLGLVVLVVSAELGDHGLDAGGVHPALISRCRR